MDWTTNVQDINATLNSSLYGNLGQGEGIDLRIEMHRILYGSISTLAKGHWVVLREFDRTKPSEFYMKSTKEGIGGSPYLYTDILLRTRRTPIGGKREQLAELKPGVAEQNMFVFYFEYTVFPKIGDDIFELDVCNNRYQFMSYHFTERYQIKKVLPYRLENGNIQYFSIIAELNQIEY